MGHHKKLKKHFSLKIITSSVINILTYTTDILTTRIGHFWVPFRGWPNSQKWTTYVKFVFLFWGKMLKNTLYHSKLVSIKVYCHIQYSIKDSYGLMKMSFAHKQKLWRIAPRTTWTNLSVAICLCMRFFESYGECVDQLTGVNKVILSLSFVSITVSAIAVSKYAITFFVSKMDGSLNALIILQRLNHD